MLDPEDRSALLRLGRPRRYRRGATVVLQGDRNDTVGILLHGRVKVSRDTPDGHEIVLAVLGPGELLGEFEAIDGNQGGRTAGNVALEPVECRVFTAGDFRDFLESHPRAALAEMRVLIGRLRAADRRRVDSATLDTTHRLARFLVELAEPHVGPDTRGIDIDIPLTQEELATLIATSRESIVRALTSLRTRGLIATARRRITVRDLDGLRQYVAW